MGSVWLVAAGLVSAQEQARGAAGLPTGRDDDVETAYRRYNEWLGCTHPRDLVLDRISVRLGYNISDVRGSAPSAR